MRLWSLFVALIILFVLRMIDFSIRHFALFRKQWLSPRFVFFSDIKFIRTWKHGMVSCRRFRSFLACQWFYILASYSGPVAIKLCMSSFPADWLWPISVQHWRRDARLLFAWNRPGIFRLNMRAMCALTFDHAIAEGCLFDRCCRRFTRWFAILFCPAWIEYALIETKRLWLKCCPRTTRTCVQI